LDQVLLRQALLQKDGSIHSWSFHWTSELQALVTEAHGRLGHRVAAHAIGWEGIDAALRAGRDSIEHGDGLAKA